MRFLRKTTTLRGQFSSIAPGKRCGLFVFNREYRRSGLITAACKAHALLLTERSSDTTPPSHTQSNTHRGTQLGTHKHTAELVVKRFLSKNTRYNLNANWLSDSRRLSDRLDVIE